MDDAFGKALAKVVDESGGRSVDLNAILRAYMREQLQDDPTGSHVPLIRFPLSALEDHLAETQRDLRERYLRRVSHIVDGLMQQHGISEESWDRVAIGVLEVDVAAYSQAIRRVRGEEPSVFTVQTELPQTDPGAAPVTARPAADPLPSEPPVPTDKAPEGPLFSTLVEPFLTRRREIDNTTHQVLGQERDTLRIFLDICGDRPVSSYTRPHMMSFHETARKLPSNRGRSPRDKTLPVVDFIARAEKAGEKRITDKTLKRHHSALSQFFRYAMDCGHISRTGFSELTAEHRFKANKSARKQRDAWQSDELQKLFLSPVWTGHNGRTRRSQAGPHIVRDGKFWLPILALFHGARLEELADLYRRDVRQDGDVWFIRFEEWEGDDDTGDRRLKTDNAERILPLHPELIRLGFLDYVSEKAPWPDDPIFPELEPQGPDKKRGPRITRWFVEYRRDIGIYRPGVAMHAFRHTARTRLSDTTQGHRERHLNYLFGHSGGGSEGATRYDKGPGLKAVAETLALLEYPGVDLSPLYPKADEP